MHLEKSGMWTPGNIVINAHTCTCLDMDADSDTVQKHYWIDFTLLDCEQEMKYGLNFPPLWVVIHFLYLFHMSKVTPECMPPTRGWLWTWPVFEFERVVRYQEYTHGFVVPLWLLYHPRLRTEKFDHYFNNVFFVSFKRRHEKCAR